MLDLQAARKGLIECRRAHEGPPAQRMSGTSTELADDSCAAAMGTKRAAVADDGYPAAGRAEPAGVYAAGLDRAVAVLSESATLCVLDTQLCHAATVGDDLADSTRSLTDVDHEVADGETWHVAPPGDCTPTSAHLCEKQPYDVAATWSSCDLNECRSRRPE